MKEQLCLDPGAPSSSEPATPAAKSSASAAANGGPSTASGGTLAEPAESTIVAEPAARKRVEIDGWTADDSNVCGHKIHRTIRRRDATDFPLSISLTAGDMDDEVEPIVDVSERALRWLLTGEFGT